MAPELSIIIPCFNCEKTLTEAVDSCFRQGLRNFEIIMVDDGSTDHTRSVMEALAHRHTEITLIAHDVNKGGGAARNTGIQNSHGTFIYCLDSDNILSDGSLRHMIDFNDKEKIDGAAFYNRRYFHGTSTKHYTSHLNSVLERNIEIADLFNETHTLLDNFLYTRESFDRTPGYPTHHGFDSQGFEVRYLASGNSVRVCPDSIFYHRQGRGGGSYFERVYASGQFSINYALIFEEIFYLLSPAMRVAIADFSIFEKNKVADENLFELIGKRIGAGEPFFADDYRSYLVPTGSEVWERDHTARTESVEPTEHLTRSILDLQKSQYHEALLSLESYIRERKNISPYTTLLGLRIFYGLAGVPYTDLVPVTLSQVRLLALVPQNTLSGPIGKIARLYPRLYAAALHIKKSISNA